MAACQADVRPCALRRRPSVSCRERPTIRRTPCIVRTGTARTGLAQIDYRWAADAERVRKYAMELVELKPDVILASSSISVAELLKITRVIPIVFAQVVDP